MKIPRSARLVCLAMLCLRLATAGMAKADDPKEDPKEANRPKIAWVDGPATAQLGDIAEIKIPAGYRFTGFTPSGALVGVFEGAPC